MSDITHQQEIIYIPVDNLDFDPQNPRLPKRLIGKNENEVIRWMLLDATLVELMASIGEQGFFPGEPLLVIPNERKPGNFTVIEGNRRLSAVKVLLDPNKAEAKENSVAKVVNEAKTRPPESLPAIIYESRNAILDYLGYRHITGIKAWDPLAKAQYLKQLADKLNESNESERFKQLAKIIGSRAPYVAELLTGLALYERMEESDFFGIRGIDETSIDFSLITTALHYNKIAAFLGLRDGRQVNLSGIEDRSLKDLTQWMFDKSGGSTRLGESRKLKLLSEVVGNPTALKAFRETGISLDDAVLLTEFPLEIFRKAIFDTKTKLELARNQLHLIRDSLELLDIDSIKELEMLLEFIKDNVSKVFSAKDK